MNQGLETPHHWVGSSQPARSANPFLRPSSFLVFPREIICGALGEQNCKEHPDALEGEQLAGLCAHLLPPLAQSETLPFSLTTLQDGFVH